jgi:hypothetical protein
MRFLMIVMCSVLAAAGYGILHDQVTARVCVEYFTVGHPRVLETESPTFLAVWWGMAATWWAGLIVGVMLAVAARAGELPKLEPVALRRPVVTLLVVMAVCAAAAGLVGFALARHGVIVLTGTMATRVPRDKHVAFLADLWAHSASYVAGFAGGLVLAMQLYVTRRRLATTYDPPRIVRAAQEAKVARGHGFEVVRTLPVQPVEDPSLRSQRA